ncbi:MAG: hypothetical protein HY835_12670, partial [Anaerolineae bacterium]|nr:hypothetical protein [Anaerolineae bacterium]
MEDNPFYQHFKDEIERNQAEDAQLQIKYQQEQEMQERREKERARCAALVVPVLQDLLFKYPGHKVIDRAEVTYRSMKIDYHGIFWPGVTYSPQKPPVD